MDRTAFVWAMKNRYVDIARILQEAGKYDSTLMNPLLVSRSFMVSFPVYSALKESLENFSIHEYLMIN